MKKLKDVFKNGLFGENPIFRLVLGTCPTIAVSTSATNAIGMGLAVTFVWQQPSDLPFEKFYSG